MATSHLMTCKHIPHFGLNSLISTLSFGEIFSYFATPWKWYCLTFWISKKSRLFRRFFQYSVICHFSKYIWLALTDFHKNKVYAYVNMRVYVSLLCIPISFFIWSIVGQTKDIWEWKGFKAKFAYCQNVMSINESYHISSFRSHKFIDRFFDSCLILSFQISEENWNSRLKSLS